jgi:hypothetical protein
VTAPTGGLIGSAAAAVRPGGRAMLRHVAIRPVGLGRDRSAVTDVMGSLLLVGMTVVAAVGFGVLLLQFDGPADKLHIDVEIRTTPGDDGVWETGDERLQVLHLGGEPLDGAVTTVEYTADGTEYSYSDDDLGSYFADDGDGLLTIGETWVSPVADALDLAQDEQVDAALVTEEGLSQLVAAGTVTGGGIDLTVTTCLPDITAPSGSFGQSPSDVRSTSSGAITVTLTVSDACTGVNEATAPVFAYCVAVTCTVPTSFTTATMADTGTRVWSATIPSQSWVAAAVAGKSIQYYATNMRDLAGNIAQTSVQTDAVDLLVTYYYADSAAVTTGTVSSFSNAQGSSVSDGNLATLAEAGVTGSAATVGPTKYYGTTVTNSGTVNANNVLASDESRNEFDTSGDSLELTGIDLPANAATVTAVTIGFEGRKASTGGTSPALRPDYKLGVGGTYSTGTALTVSNSGTDSDYTRTLTGTFTVAQVESLYVRLFYTTDTNRNPQVDAVFVTVTYQTTPQTEYRLDLQLEWFTATSGGVLDNLELRYRVQGDTFNVQVWSFLTSTWRTCSGTLTSTTLATYTCALVLGEISAGEARVRLTDVATTGTTQAFLYLDHARLAIA